MPIYNPTASDKVTISIDGKSKKLLKKDVYENFNADLLGLGDLTTESTSIDAIAAVFDLQGFTNFCKQIDPHLSVPRFLSPFLNWLMDQLKSEMTQEVFDQGASLWGPLPFFLKFMGDGLLVLWNSSETSAPSRRNILRAVKRIRQNYQRLFLTSMKKQVVDAPPILRCGIARGTVFTVGNGTDYVGSCINMAARLQKLGGTTYAFNLRGFELDGTTKADQFKKDLLIAEVSVRGIGEAELVCILKDEYVNLKAADKKQFKVL